MGNSFVIFFDGEVMNQVSMGYLITDFLRPVNLLLESDRSVCLPLPSDGDTRLSAHRMIFSDESSCLIINFLRPCLSPSFTLHVTIHFTLHITPHVITHVPTRPFCWYKIKKAAHDQVSSDCLHTGILHRLFC